MDIIGNLPIELTHKIFKYLDAPELCICCCVSRRWRHCANSNHLWKPICVRKEIVCELDYEPQVEGLEPMVEWGKAYLKYAKQRFVNWRNGAKKQTLLSSCCKPMACCDGESLIFTNISGLVFIFDVTGMTPNYVQTIELPSRNNLSSLQIAKGVLLIRQMDSFTIYIRSRVLFRFKGYMLRLENRFIFTQNFFESYGNPIALQSCVVNGLVVILARHYIFTCMIEEDVEVTDICLIDNYFFFYDRYRIYTVASDKTIAAFCSNLQFEYFNLPVDSMVGIKSNKNLVVALTCVKGHYCFHTWNTKKGKNKTSNSLGTVRPYGFKVHGKENKFAYVTQDKAKSLIKVYLRDVDSKNLKKLDLNINVIAQAKLFFVGRDHLYVAVRRDWEMYSSYYFIDLNSMHVLYKDTFRPSSIIHVDSNHAVYCKDGAILIDTFREP